MKTRGIIVLVIGSFFFAHLARAQWTSPKRLSWTSGDSRDPAIALSSPGTVHVVWAGETVGSMGIYYKKSTNGGVTWMASRRLTWNSAYFWTPSITVDPSGNLHVVWSDNRTGLGEIFYMRSTDEGVSWTATQWLSWTSDLSASPVIVADPSGGLHLAWEDYTPGPTSEIYYKRSTNGGKAWTANKRLTWTAGSRRPALAADAFGRLHIAWESYTPGPTPEIYYKVSANGGDTWTAQKRLTWTSGWSQSPAIIVASSGRLQALWHDDPSGNFEIYGRGSADGGVSWTPIQRLSWTSGTTGPPSLVATASGSIYAFWNDDTPGNYEIYCRKSPDGGTTWNPVQRLCWTSGWSDAPVGIADTFGEVHLVWSDPYTIFNREIYYQRGK
jgi:hypothetical protein